MQPKNPLIEQLKLACQNSDLACKIINTTNQHHKYTYDKITEAQAALAVVHNDLIDQLPVSPQTIFKIFGMLHDAKKNVTAYNEITYKLKTDTI